VQPRRTRAGLHQLVVVVPFVRLRDSQAQIFIPAAGFVPAFNRPSLPVEMPAQSRRAPAFIFRRRRRMALAAGFDRCRRWACNSH
jgi:hypothetical protein